MKIFKRFIGHFTFLLLLSSTIIALLWLMPKSQTEPVQAVNPPLKKESAMKILSEKEGEIIFEIKTLLFQTTEITKEGKSYKIVNFPEGVLDESKEGKPALPLISSTVAVNKGSVCQSEVVEPVFREIENVEIFPAQPPSPESLEEEEKFIKDEDFYKLDEFYPTETVVVEKESVFRGTALRTIYFYPFSFNPALKILRHNESFKVKLICQGGKKEDLSKKGKDFFAPLKKRVIKNSLSYQESPGETLLTLSEGADFLIITTGGFQPAAENLAIWRRQKGFLTAVKTTAETGSTSEAITSFIQNAYQTWNPAPSFVLLLGDAEFIPTNYKTKHPYDKILIGTDLYYATVDGTDYLPDLAIGRISVDNLEQAHDRINKIIGYEKNPPSEASFYTNGGVAAYLQDDPPQDNYDDRPFIQTSEEIRDFLQSIGYSWQRLYNTNNLNATNYSLIYDSGDPLPPDLHPGSGFLWDADNIKINSLVNNGVFWLNHRDHGGPGGWGHPAYSTADVNALSNGDKLPFVSSLNCQTGWFDNETDSISSNDNYVCFAESWIRNLGGGAVGIIAHSRTSYSGHNDYLNKGFLDAIWPSFLSYSGSTDSIYYLGQDLTYAKIYYATIYPDYITRKVQIEELHLFGDPTTEIWTGIPQNMTLTAPDSVGIGVSSLSVLVNQEGALVTVLQNGNLLGMAYSQNGTATINLNPSAQEGVLTVTGSKHNFRPLWSEVKVQKPEAVSFSGCWPYRYSDGKVIVYWESASEINNLGYDVYFNQTNDLSSAVKINNELIMPVGFGSLTGGEYRFEDLNKPASGFYWIFSLDTGGMTEKFGPFILEPAPLPPTGLKIKTSTKKSLLIVWNGVLGKTYDLEISKCNSSGQIISSVVISEITANQYSQKPGLATGKYKVRVREKYGEWSAYKSFSVSK